MANIKQTLQKVSNNEDLSEEEKQSIEGLIIVLNKSLERFDLNEDERKQISELIKKGESGSLKPGDYFSFARVIFNLIELLKDST